MQAGPFPLRRRGRLYSLPPPVTAGRRWDDRHGAGVDKLARGGIHNKFKHSVVPDELVVHVPQDELPFSHGEPGYDVVGPEGGQLVVVLHVAVGCV